MGFFVDRQDCYLIAEIGVNNAGDVDLAKKMIAAAKAAGADAVKFQTFTAEALVTKDTPKVQYQEETTSPEESHFEMIKALEFQRDDHRQVMEYCEQLGVDFLSTAYDVESGRFLDELGVKVHKVASADLVDLPLNEYLASTAKPVIISTGMATLGEVEEAVEVYRRVGNLDICLLHCVSNYPCSLDSLNMRVMNTLAAAFQLPVGFSDHSVGNIGAILSVALGAKVIEKHFTLDKSMIGPDHRASSTPEEFAEMVRAVRDAECALGSSRKACQEEERQMSLVSRKSITATRQIPAGKTIEKNDLTMKRPGTGLRSSHLNAIIGRKAVRKIAANKVLSWHDLMEG